MKRGMTVLLLLSVALFGLAVAYDIFWVQRVKPGTAIAQIEAIYGQSLPIDAARILVFPDLTLRYLGEADASLLGYWWFVLTTPRDLDGPMRHSLYRHFETCGKRQALCQRIRIGNVPFRAYATFSANGSLYTLRVNPLEHWLTLTPGEQP